MVELQSDDMNLPSLRLQSPPGQFCIPAKRRIAAKDRHPAFGQADPVEIAEHLGVCGIGTILVLHFKLKGVAVFLPADQQVEALAAKRVLAYDLPPPLITRCRKACRMICVSALVTILKGLAEPSVSLSGRTFAL